MLYIYSPRRDTVSRIYHHPAFPDPIICIPGYYFHCCFVRVTSTVYCNHFPDFLNKGHRPYLNFSVMRYCNCILAETVNGEGSYPTHPTLKAKMKHQFGTQILTKAAKMHRTGLHLSVVLPTPQPHPRWPHQGTTVLHPQGYASQVQSGLRKHTGLYLFTAGFLSFFYI